MLSEWSIEPVPQEAYEAPCPAFDGGGFRAEAIGQRGINSYLSNACKDVLPEGILRGPQDESHYDKLSTLVDELLR